MTFSIATQAKAREVCLKFIERAEALGYPKKGKKLDDAALDYIVGAAVGAELAGDSELHESLKLLAMYGVSLRGMMAIRERAAGRV